VNVLLDTNVLSEVVRPRADEAVMRWLSKTPAESLFVSVLTLGEIRKGVERLEAGAKRDRLREWLETDVPTLFEERILAVDAAVADRWGRLTAQAKRSVPAVDALIAATALVHDLRLATRNTADYAFPGLDVFDPWEHESS